MKQLSHVGITSCLVLIFLLTNLPGWAQEIQDDSLTVSSNQSSQKEIDRLKAALRPMIKSMQVADTLLAQSRQLVYLPGQVVALCHLAGIRLQQQQPQQATDLLQEAAKIAEQIRDIKESGWAMSQVGKMIGINARKNPSFSTALSPVLDALGVGMRITGSIMAKAKNPGSISIDVPIPPRKRTNDWRPSPSIPTDYLSSLPVPTYDPSRFHHSRLKPDLTDRWIDTLINSATSTPQVVSQLTARKKLRDSSQALSKAFAKEGDYAQAYRYFLQYSSYKDSLTAEATTRRLASLEYKQNLLKKEAQIQLLTKDRQLSDQESHKQRLFVLGLGGCIALLGAFSLILIRNNRAKQQANRQLNEQKEALQQTLAELKTAQVQLIQAEKMASLGELTAGIAHEIQNPLNFVNNFSEVSTELVNELVEHRQNSTPDKEFEDELLGDLQQNLQKINQHGNRASAIVKGMLEHSRTSGSEKQLTDLNALADEYLKLAYHGIRAKDSAFEAHFTADYDSNLRPVTIVPQEVGRVLLNVFNNAFYAVRQRQQRNEPDYQPVVAVYTQQKANQVTIKIRDNGTGIPSAIKQKIFQPFFTTKPTGQGTGLGLSLSYDVITKGHGGTLTLESTEGEFTEITISLPTAV